jgi:hypothetical protein
MIHNSHSEFHATERIIPLRNWLNIQKAIENGHEQFVGLPIRNGGFL